MKLEIVVLHYHEPWDMVKYLLDTIKTQKGVDWSDIGVFIVNDGDDVVLDEANFAEYPFSIRYDIKEHTGISGTRNYGIENSTADYIMFCDSDDGFLNNYGLHTILDVMAENPDMIISSFAEELLKNGKYVIVRHDKDIVFCHGKVYRRQFLLDKNLRFDTELAFCEDSLFNKIAFHEAALVKSIESPLYLWAWNNTSTTRKQKECVVLLRYHEAMLMRIRTCEQLRDRGFTEEYFKIVAKVFFDCYYEFNDPDYMVEEYADLYKAAEEEFKVFCNMFIADFLRCDLSLIAQTMMECRQIAYSSGMYMESFDFKSWLRRMSGVEQ